MNCIASGCYGELRELTDQEIEEEIGEDHDMAFYKCKSCGGIFAADVLAEAEQEAQARKRRMRQRERRARGW